MKKIFLILLSFAVFTACERKISTFSVTSGSANFSKYVCLGNSLCAGYADGALYHNGQVYSIPNLVAGQLQMAGSGNFVQPLVTSEFGVAFTGSGTKLKLGYSTDCRGVTSLGPIADIGAEEPLGPVGYDVNNFAVPGAKSFHLLAPHYGDPQGLMTYPPTANPYFYRFAKTAASSVLGDALTASPTFFLLWIGDNDVLSYALSGGTSDTITSPSFFQLVMGDILQQLTAASAKGVIATIPDVTAIPYFNTIPYNGLVLTQSEADSVNMAMTLYQLPYHYTAGANPFLVTDTTATNLFKVRQMKPGELVLLSIPQDSLKCVGMGIISRLTERPYPIPKKYFLSLSDISKIQATTTAYNQIISGLATNFKLGVVDMNTKLKELQSGIVWDGISLNTTFVTGGVFSLDGIHLNPRGCALTANFIIDAINNTYKSTIPYVNVTNYPGVIFP
jgi:lysophospholipase L1-like esterase